jgi:hypothetical protein
MMAASRQWQHRCCQHTDLFADRDVMVERALRKLLFLALVSIQMPRNTVVPAIATAVTLLAFHDVKGSGIKTTWLVNNEWGFLAFKLLAGFPAPVEACDNKPCQRVRARVLWVKLHSNSECPQVCSWSGHGA